MTREEVMILDMEGCEERAAKIAEETRDASEEILAELSAELDMIEERKNIIKDEAEEKRAAMEAVLEGEGEVIEEVKEEERTMTDVKEIRKSPEYLDAWVENLKGRASEEQRTLLTTNAEDGTIAVPTYVEDRINTAWESNEIVRRAKKSYFKGNLKVAYEASAEGAQMHQEGGNAITEEDLEIAFTELTASTLKKMVKYSSEVLSMKGEAFVDYIVDEIEYQIAKTAGDGLVQGAIATAQAVPALVGTYTAAGSSLTTADVVGAEGLLAGDANPVLITTRANAAALKAAVLGAGYGYDPFDGMDVVYVDAAAINGALAVVADMSAWQINFPDGDDVKFVFDEFTEAPADIVRVIGRLYAGIGIVAPYKTVVIKAHA